jgi:hypothetical protein
MPTGKEAVILIRSIRGNGEVKKGFALRALQVAGWVKNLQPNNSSTGLESFYIFTHLSHMS